MFLMGNKGDTQEKHRRRKGLGFFSIQKEDWPEVFPNTDMQANEVGCRMCCNGLKYKGQEKVEAATRCLAQKIKKGVTHSIKLEWRSAESGCAK